MDGIPDVLDLGDGTFVSLYWQYQVISFIDGQRQRQGQQEHGHLAEMLIYRREAVTGCTENLS